MCAEFSRKKFERTRHEQNLESFDFHDVTLHRSGKSCKEPDMYEHDSYDYSFEKHCLYRER